MTGDASVPRPSSLGWRRLRIRWFDFLWATLAAPIAFYVRNPDYFQEQQAPFTLVYAVMAVACTLPCFIVFNIDSAMSRYFSLRDAYAVVGASVLAAALTAVAHFSIARLDDVPRSLPFLHALILAGGLLAGRGFARQKASWTARTRELGEADETENVIIVGATRLAWFYLRTLDEIAPESRRVVGIVDRRSRLTGRAISGRTILGLVEDIERLITEYAVHGLEIHRIVLTEPLSRQPETVRAQIAALAERGIEVQSLDDVLFLPRSVARSPVRLAQSSRIEIERCFILRRPYWRVKRCIDFVSATVFIVMFAPLVLPMMAIALFDVGLPVLFWQQRIGRNGRAFPVYKFRTLRSPTDSSGRRLSDDERLSAIGRFVRASRLDEIPQLTSILRGHMSLIGPRPLLPVDQPDKIGLRLLVAPGLTGWAQINGGKLVNAAEKNALDEWYVRHASLRLDLWILIMTPIMMIRGDRRGEAAIAAALAEQLARSSVPPSIVREGRMRSVVPNLSSDAA